MVVRTLHPGGAEMADNGNGAEDDVATEEAREMGINGEGSIRVCKSTHMYFLYPFFRTIIPQIKYINPLMGHVIP